MVRGENMQGARWGEFADLDQFAAQPLANGRFCVDIDTARFECLFDRGVESRLFVLLSGARDPASQPLPKFDRWSWAPMFPGSVLCISDPTLALAEDTLRIGWYIGTARHDWLRSMADLVRAVAGRLGLSDNAVVCYGSSAGGFAAMMLAAELGRATAVAINPQTNVTHYSARYVRDLLIASFDGRQVAALTEKERARFSAIEKLQREPEVKCLIAQNVQDTQHYREHYMPLCEALGIPAEGGLAPSGRLGSLLFDSSLGHGPEPAELAPDLIWLGAEMSRAGRLQSMSVNQEERSRIVEAKNDKPSAIDKNGTLTLRSIRLSEKPIWIDVEQGELAELELHASVKGWPAESRGTALFMLEMPEGGTPFDLKAHGLAYSASIGPYVYLDHFLKDGEVHCKLSIPGGQVARIGLRLWSWKKEIFLENARLTPRGGKLTLRTADKAVAVFKNMDEAEEDALAVDLLHTRNGCTEACVTKAMNWYSSMDAYQNKSPASDLGRTDCFFPTAKDEYACVSAFHARPSMLAVPHAIDVYAQRIGDKSRNMVRKAARAGYVYMPVDPNQYIDDVVAIRTSAPIRQGKEIPAYFRQRPRVMLPEQWCDYHGDAFYGIFKDGKLVAYLTLFMYGQLAQVNHFLGHADHMKEGVMNLLMYEVVNDLIRNRPWVRAINYMYSGSSTSAGGTALFKRSMGFETRRLLIAHDDPKFADVLEEKRRQREQQRAAAADAERAAAAEKPVARIDSAELGDKLDAQAFSSRAEAFVGLLHAAGDGTSLQTQRFTFEPEGDQCAAPELLEAGAIVVDGVNASNVVKFLSAGFKQFKSSVTKGAFVLFDFPADPQAGQAVPGANGTGDGETNPLQPTIDYFKRRFKSAVPSPDAVRDGFKGSDFVVKAMGMYPGSAAGGTVLLLKKIR